jgi:hypothetical protein
LRAENGSIVCFIATVGTSHVDYISGDS